MLIIRKEQMQALKDHMLLQFGNRMVDHLRTGFSNQTDSISDEDLHAMVQAGIEKALSYNISLEDDVQRFLEFTIMLGPDFDENPEVQWAGDILKRDDIGGTQKMDSISYHIVFSLGVENG